MSEDVGGGVPAGKVGEAAETDARGYRGALDLDEVERFIALRCEDVTLAEVAQRFGCHPNSVTRALRLGRGRSFRDVLRAARAARACGLLDDGATVEEAAEGCGYDNLGHFYRMFRAELGVTPGAYRRRSLGARVRR